MARSAKKKGSPDRKEKKPVESAPPPRSTWFSPSRLLILFLLLTNAVTLLGLGYRISQLESWRRYDGMATAAESGESPIYNVVNAHDHLYKLEHLPKYLEAARNTGIRRTLFVASSAFTFLGKKGKKEDLNDWSSLEILKAAKQQGPKIIPFCTLYPGDPDKLEKLKSYVAQGVQGLKLYSGHSNFYDRPLDDPGMMEVYAYCEEIGLPICWHVRLPYYKKEFRRVMQAHPKLKVILPHFGVAFYQPSPAGFRELRSLLDTYPNLYVDNSFGTRSILVHGLELVSRHRDFFREFYLTYSGRILFGTDMVVTGNKEKTEEWIEAVIRACRDVLEKDRYHFYMAAKGSPYAYKAANNLYGELRGLALPEDALRKIYETNIDKILMKSEP